VRENHFSLKKSVAKKYKKMQIIMQRSCSLNLKQGGGTMAKKKVAKKKAAKKKVAKKKVAKKKVAKKKTAKKKTAKKKTAKKKTAKKKTAKKKTAKKRKPNPAFMRPVSISAALSAIVGNKPIPRTEVTKKLWAYIKKNKLQDAINKRMINADEKLKAVLGKAKVTMFEMTKLVNKHRR